MTVLIVDEWGIELILNFVDSLAYSKLKPTDTDTETDNNPVSTLGAASFALMATRLDFNIIPSAIG
jgi:hypothetical protein